MCVRQRLFLPHLVRIDYSESSTVRSIVII
jgi:hypothetical protein